MALRYTTLLTKVGTCDSNTYSASISKLIANFNANASSHRVGGRKMMGAGGVDQLSDVSSDLNRIIQLEASILADDLHARPLDDPVKHRHLAHFEVTPARADLSWAQVADLTFCHIEVILALNKGLRDANGNMPTLRDIVGKDIFVCT